jgi:hypothetical protein
MTARLLSLKNRARSALLAAACLLAAGPAAADDLYKVDEAKPIYSTPKPAPGKAMIYFVRSTTLGSAVKVKLYADGKFLGLVMSQTFIAYECDPGKHEFIAAAENAGFLEADLAADRVYLVEVAIHMGAWKARTHFETARAGSDALRDIEDELPNVHPVQTTAEGRAWVAERQAKFDETIRKFRDKGEEFEALKPGDGFENPPWLKKS